MTEQPETPAAPSQTRRVGVNGLELNVLDYGVPGSGADWTVH